MTNKTNRFAFPGFTLLRQADSSTHEVEVGTIQVGGETLVAHLIRRKGLPEGASFLLARVLDMKEEKRFWEFPKGTFNGIGLLAKAGDEVVVALTESGKDGKVIDVVSLTAHLVHTPLDLLSRVTLKRQAAEFLGREYTLTKTEGQVAKAMANRRLKEEEDARKAAADRRHQARIEFRQAVLARGTVTAYAADGSERRGYPVIEAEWPRLSNGVHVILVESYDEKAKTSGTPIEAFRVVKESGKNPTKGFPTTVTWERPVVQHGQASADAPRPLETIVVEKDDLVYEVALYASMDDIRAARAAGLNSGTFVAAKDRIDKGGAYEVLSVRSDSVDTIGKFMPMV